MYLFAKDQLESALEVVASGEADTKAGDGDMAALADVKRGVQAMLEDCTSGHRKYWEDARGREPPSMDEWYEIADDEGEASEIVKDPVTGEDIPGPVTRWPQPPHGMFK